MNIFIVYAHPEPKSFNGGMLHRALDVLTSEGHDVVVSDLYQMRFKAAVDADDFTDPLDEMYFDLQQEQHHAVETGAFSPDIIAEQRKLVWSETLILQFPLWWYGLPAILKGWIDRVLAYGFAYGRGQSLAGRRVMLVTTTGGPLRAYTSQKQRTISDMLDTVQRGTFYFCGMDVLPPYAVYGASNADAEQREQLLDQYGDLLRSIEQLPPIEYGV